MCVKVDQHAGTGATTRVRKRLMAVGYATTMTPIDRTEHVSRVYSSATGRVRPEHGQKRAAATGPADGVVRVSRTKSGRGGKTVTLVMGLPPSAVDATAKELKRICGTGGTAKDGVVEIQGDHRQRIVDHLSSTYTTKLAGG